MNETLPERILSVLRDGPKSRRELEAATGEPNLTKQLAAMRSLGTVATVGQRRGLKYTLPANDEA